MSKFDELREQYKEFSYEGFETAIEDQRLKVAYTFRIPGLTDFVSGWEFPVAEGTVPQAAEDPVLQRLLFSLGMAESISYWKCVCPKILHVRCGSLSEQQNDWWRKLYYNGLGEFMYRNGIEIAREDLVQIDCVTAAGEPLQDDGTAGIPLHDSRSYDGVLVPVGGGKDSVVSLEVLKNEKITTYSINGNETTRNVISACTDKCGDYAAKRILDKRILEMNARGLLNGHIPFSSVVAFSSVIAAYLSGSRYIALSNETSANETTVKDSFVNHQYSKSLEFEQDFTWYLKTLTDSDIHYFSFLRPLTELQIAWLFSRAKAYHRIFRSCNRGSKTGIWCCNCPKCLFVYIILTPFLSQEYLTGIFGENLLNKESLDLDFRELTGIEENKPFECVGTRREVLAALKYFVQKGGRSLLTDRYSRAISSAQGEIEVMLKEWSGENQVPENYQTILKRYMEQ